MVVGNKNKRGRKKEKEGRGFGRLPSFFFVFLTVFFAMVLLRCGDFGPNLVVFFVCTLRGIRVGGDTGSGIK